MVGYEDLAQLWGEKNICRLSPELLEGIDLPEGTKTVLTQVGLPIAVEWFFETDLCQANRLPTEIDPPGRPGRWYRIGSDYGADICVEAESGVVMSISTSGEYPDCFLNSSLEAFIDFLYLFYRVRKPLHSRMHKEINAATLALQKKIDAATLALQSELQWLDPRAFDDTENWWSVIFEQVEDGLL